MEECQEPRCKAPATKVWGGRRVCEDHYEEYREKQDRLLMEMRDL